MRRKPLTCAVLLVLPLVLSLRVRAQSSSDSIDAHKLLVQALDAANLADDSEAKTQVLRTLLIAQVFAGDGQDARHRADNVPRDQNGTYREVVCDVATALARRGDEQAAIATLAAEGPDAGSWCYESVASVQGQLGNVAAVKELASKIEDSGSHVSALACAGEEAAVAGKKDASDELFALALTYARSSQAGYERLVNLAFIAGSMYRSGKSSDILGLLPEMRADLQAISDPAERGSAEHFFLIAEERAGDLVGVKEFINAMQDEASRSSAAYDLVIELFEQGEAAKARSEMELVQDPGQKDSALEWLGSELAKQGDIEGARQIAGIVSRGREGMVQIPPNEPYDSIISQIALQQGKQGNLQEAIQTVSSLMDDKDRARTLILLGAAAPASGQDALIAEIFSEARNAALKIPEPFFLATALSHLAGVLSRRGQFALAQAAADAIPMTAEDYMVGDLQKHRGHALENIAYWRCKTGSCKDALQWSSSEPYPILKAYATAGIIEALLGMDPPSDHYIEENYGA